MGKLVDLTGESFGKLVVSHRVENLKNNGVLWLCYCDCGGKKEVLTKNLRDGKTKSCGCIKIDRAERTRLRNYGSDCKSKTPEYTAWIYMKQKAQKHFEKTGEIIVCKYWLESFDAFLEDLGERPNAKCSLRRIREDEMYSAPNCDWGSKPLLTTYCY
jgi:hypothetical protein